MPGIVDRVVMKPKVEGERGRECDANREVILTQCVRLGLNPLPKVIVHDLLQSKSSSFSCIFMCISCLALDF